MQVNLNPPTCPRMLGYSAGFPETGSAYGVAEPDEEFGMSDVTCNGNEESLLDCLARNRGTCGRGEVASVTCFQGTTRETTTWRPTTRKTTRTSTSTTLTGGFIFLKKYKLSYFKGQGQGILTEAQQEDLDELFGSDSFAAGG